MLLHWALSTMVISQKAPVVEHCEQVGCCVFLPVSSIDAKLISSAQHREIFTAPVQGHFHDVVTFGKCTNLHWFRWSEFRAHNTKDDFTKWVVTE